MTDIIKTAIENAIGDAVPDELLTDHKRDAFQIEADAQHAKPGGPQAPGKAEERDWRGETPADRKKREDAAMAEWASGAAERAEFIVGDEPDDDDE
jgi:hypothetical protein